MDIIKIKPQGFCMGVAKAINIINKTLNDPTVIRPIYMLGNVVHNKNIVNAFKNKGIIVLDGETRKEMLDMVISGTIIFTAHGVSDAIRQTAIDKGLFIVDATCKDVKKTHQLIKSKLNEGYIVYFYGVDHHPETEGILGLSDQIILVTDQSDLNDIPKTIDRKAVLTTQTTMSYLDVTNFYHRLKVFVPQLELVEEVCNATRLRQTAIIDYKNKLDLLIVVGDPNSNNTKMLKEVGEKKAQLKTLFLERVEDLTGQNLKNFHKIGVTAGASTPNAIVEEIINSLKNNDHIFKSHLKDDDFIK
ncbi:MAG: 4-hydroxy-3-methylbut-2-enyl diphosphate reductase [Bacilli bacterium]